MGGGGESDFLDLGREDAALAGFGLGPALAPDALGSRYAGRREEDGAPVSIRALHPGFEKHPALLEQVLADARSWLGFADPGAAEVLATGSARGRWLVVAAEPPGERLDAVLAKRPGGRLEGAEALAAARSLAAALAAAHERGLACGDLRPGTIAWDGARARLVDLGLARAACATAGFGRLGLRFGHPAYLAPETIQRGADRPSPAADVYALGITLYELIAGAPPFRAEGPALLRAHFDAPLPRPPADVRLPGPLAGAILHATAKSPERRPAASALAAALGAAPAAWAPAPVEGGAEEDDGLGRPTGRLDESVRPGPREDLELGAQLGRGPLGTTYEGAAEGLDGLVAVKVISRRYQGRVRARLLEGLRAATRLEHPKAVRVLDVRSVGGRDVAVQEKAAGGTLRAALDARGRLPAAEVVDLARDLGEALAGAEAIGLAHGDVRPEKVYVAEGAPARLADWGQAEASSRGAGFADVGLRFGHPDYGAPELATERRRTPDAAVDLYALGVVLYEALAGRRPFAAEAPADAVAAHVSAPVPPLPADVDAAPWLRGLITRLLAKTPAGRPESAAAFLEALERGPEGAAAPAAGFYLSDEALPGEWEQESLLLSQPDAEWDPGRIASASAEGEVVVEEWRPDASEEGDLRTMMSSDDLSGPARAQVLAELGLDPAAVAAQARQEEAPPAAAGARCALCAAKLDAADLAAPAGPIGPTCAACRAGAGDEVRVQGEPSAEEVDEKARLERVLQARRSARARRLKAAAYGLLFFAGIGGLVHTVAGPHPAVSAAVGAVLAAFGASAVVREG